MAPQRVSGLVVKIFQFHPPLPFENVTLAPSDAANPIGLQQVLHGLGPINDQKSSKQFIRIICDAEKPLFQISF